MPKAKPKKLREEAIALAKRMPLRDVEAKLGVSKSVIGNWVRAARAAGARRRPENAPPASTVPKPAGELHRRKKPPSTPAETAPRAGAPRRREAKRETPDRLDDEGGASDLPAELADIDLAALDFEALEELDRDVVAFRRQARADEDVRAYATLARLQLDIRVAMAKVRPPPAADPMTDPANVEARDTLRGLLESIIADEEKDAPPVPPEALAPPSSAIAAPAARSVEAIPTPAPAIEPPNELTRLAILDLLPGGA